MSTMSARRRLVTVLAVPVVTSGLVIAAAGGAQAATEYVGGGTWYHGITVTNVYSTYDNDVRTHRASVTTSAQFIDSGWKSKGVRAAASAQASVSGNKANYDFIS